MSDLPDDLAVKVLIELIAQLEHTATELSVAVGQSHQALVDRTDGRPWRDIVEQEGRPLIIQRISQALSDLGDVGGRFRREQARTLLREGLSTTEIATLFGVSRQRVSALVQEPPHGDAEPSGRS